MINRIIDAICTALFKDFGDEYKIYTDEVKQGMKVPCFFVYSINPTKSQFLGNRYFNQNIFTVLYFPSNDEISIEINDVVERLFNCLEYITESDDLIRGTNMKAEIVDNVLNFIVHYDLFTIKEQTVDTMEGLENSTVTKGDEI